MGAFDDLMSGMHGIATWVHNYAAAKPNGTGASTSSSTAPPPKPYTIPEWLTKKSVWNEITLGKDTLRARDGVINVVSGNVGRKLDVKSPAGSDGASLTDQGLEPAKLTITLVALDQASGALVEAVLAKIDPKKKGSASQPITIVHPSPNSRGVTSIAIKSVSMPEIVDTACTWKIEATEWYAKPKPKAAAKPLNGSTSTSTNGAAPSSSTVAPLTPLGPPTANAPPDYSALAQKRRGEGF